MARESGNLIQQIGVQTVLGTAVSATKKFAGLVFDIGDAMDTKQSRRQGAKFNTTSRINKEWSAGSFSGPLSYVEICYALAALFPYTVAAVTGAAGAYKWTFTPNAQGNDDAKIFTLEDGDDEAAQRFQDLILQSLDIAFNRDDPMMSGDCFAKPLDPSLGALTSSGVTDLAERPVEGKEIDVFMDDTFGAIGTTKITDAMDARFSMGAKRDMKYVLNSDYPSWKEPKELIPDGTLSVTTEHNAQSRALLAALKTNPVKFFRQQAKGPLITGTTFYQIRVDFCGKIKAKNPQRDLDGIYAYGYDFAPFQEATMGRGYQIEVINMLSAL